MDEHIKRERYLTECRDNAARKRIHDRHLTRQERAFRKHRAIYLLCVALWGITLVAILILSAPKAGGSDVAKTEEVRRVNEIPVIVEVEVLEGDDVPATEYAVIPENATEMAVKATAYCPCPTCCGKWSGGPTASGVMPEQGRTIAVDPTVIPMGSTVIIDGHEYTAEDTGSAILGNRIDIYFDSHQDALEWGVQEITIYVLEEI